MKEQSRPEFLIKKYYSILRSAIAVELVSFFVTLTDSLVAGNMIGSDTLIAVGILSPLVSIELFISIVINSGTLLFYNQYIGKYDKKTADEYFGQGIILSVLSGLLIILGMLVFEDFYIDLFTLSPKIEQYTRNYYVLIVFYHAMNPLSCLLDNTMMSEGGEKLSAVANIAEIISNILLSVLFVKPFGIRGIALASVICKLLFFVIISRWFYKRVLSLIRSIKPQPEKWREIFFNGVIRASAAVFSSAADYILLLYVSIKFGEETITILTISINALEITSVFVGLSMVIQPLVGTLRGEENTWGLRSFMNKVAICMSQIGIVISLITIVFASYIVRMFGIEDGELLRQGTIMMRCLGLSFVFYAGSTLFFVYDYLMQKNGLSFMVAVMSRFVLPVFMTIVGVKITGSPIGLWIGVVSAPMITLLLHMIVTILVYGKDSFPWLVSKKMDQQILCYDFVITEENVVSLSETLVGRLEENGYTRKLASIAGVLVEDILLLTKDKNPEGKKIDAECCVIMKVSEVRITLRDSGVIYDVTKCEKAESLRDYVVSQIVTLPEEKHYLSTTGYNRIELLLSSKA
ncbi:MATE family efflux transporter [Butyrivibrio sp. WCE2006]|uniref:MATE family efflux transporter n=1 Tax=Butyrivibrio sp. WCE2006 TaxID=1410611 RepID=UPI0005D20F9A|nr:MATE family efflux transporter [Butyrivibrio sp. WCE2006]